MSEIHLTIDGIALPIDWAGDLSADDEHVGGFSFVQMADGSQVYQEAWKKRRLSLQGRCLRPPALEGVDWVGGFELGWIHPDGIVQASNVFTIPAARRSDAWILAFANVERYGVVAAEPAAVSVVGNTATVTVVTGALSYSVHWFPLITMRGQRPRVTHDINAGVFTFALEAQEV